MVIAMELERLNRERQEIEWRIIDEAAAAGRSRARARSAMRE